MEELYRAVARGAGWAARGAVWLWETVGPTPDEERDPTDRKERFRHPDRQRPLTPGQLAEAEAELGIVLPAEYRAFLLDPPKDGGPKPGAPVNPLTRTADGWRWRTEYTIAYDSLAADFPHPGSYAAEDDALRAREPRQDDFPDPAAFDTAYLAWEREAEAFEEAKTVGAVVIRDGGCGFSTLLVVSGPLAGTMWFDGRASCDLILPLKKDDRPGTFAEWLTGETPADPW
ncbi:SMI1/KNR4 family protein [Streptomyces sp. NPDC020875]|uniref:SMI1/KNR4 family protein n=1 Tax=Streptomyces sp. NPDC020875 TaxID=3154898 RepID=UPI0033EC0CE5